MRSLGELGIGLSIVFCVFVLALVGELCYIFYWKKSGFLKSTSAHCLKSTTEINTGRRLRRPSAEFAREASLVGSFGGYPAICIPTEVGGGSDDASGFLHSSSEQPLHLLFPIKEETKEDLELAAGLGGTTKPHSRLRSRTPSDVLTIHFTSGSSSPVASADTPFTTPPSSPSAIERSVAVVPKLSPFAACAVRPMSCGKASSPVAEMQGCQSATPAANHGVGRTPLRLLFQRSPLLGARPAATGEALACRAASVSLAGGAGSAGEAGPHINQRLSLAALFGQSSSPCFPLSSIHHPS